MIKFVSVTIIFIFNIIFIPKIIYSFWFIISIFLFKKCLNISNYSIFNFFLFYSSSKSIQISLIIPSLISFFSFFFLFSFYFFSIKGFLMLLILFCVFGLLIFFSLPYMVYLGVFVLKGLTTLSLKPPTIFVGGSGI